MRDVSIIVAEYVLPVVITVASGWMVFEFVLLCRSERKFRQMRITDDEIRDAK